MNNPSHEIKSLPDARGLQLQALGLDSIRLDRLLGLCQVRAACQDDAAALAGIFNQSAFNGCSSLLGRHVTAAEMALEIQYSAESGWPFWVCLSHQQVLAFMNLRPFSWASSVCFETAEFSVYISAAWHGTGLGGDLYTLALVLAEQHGCHNLACWILGNNQPSLKLARKFFTDWACFPSLAFSADVWCDVLVLGTSLEQWFAGAQGQSVRRRQLHAVAELSALHHAAPGASIPSLQGSVS